MGSFVLWLMIAAATTAAMMPQTLPGRWGLRVAGVAAWLSVTVLAVAFVKSDWRLSYVVDNTRVGLSWPLRLAGMWGGPEGSLLLWTAMIVTYAWLAAKLAPTAESTMWATRIGGALGGAYGLIVGLAANPFVTVDAPGVGGLGLQPVLEHPAMVWHPPILYSGLAGLVLPAIGSAAIGLSNRQQREGSQAGAELVPKACLMVPLGLLSLGLGTGALWAHVELGWGGYWAWDPIESAGLVAWLFGVAALHGGHKLNPNNRLVATMLLAAGVAAIWATTLTRVGLIDSVHTFADRPVLRQSLLVVAFGWSALMLAGFAGTRFSDRQPLALGPRSKGALVLALAAGVIAAGTYEPLLEAATSGDTVSIAGRFFSRATWPVVMAGGLLATWADRRWLASLLGAVLAVLTTPWAAGPFGLAVAAVGGAVGISAVATVRGGRQRSGMLAHLGIGVLLVGVAGTMASEVRSVVLFANRPTQVAGVTLTHRGIELIETPELTTALATVDADTTVLHPALVSHDLRLTSTAEVATQFGWTSELQLVLLDGSDDQATYRVARHPRVLLVWLGAGLLALGLLIGAGQKCFGGLLRRRHLAD